MQKKGVNIDLFSRAQGRGDLKNEAIRGGVIAVTTRGLTTIIQVGGTIVLARLLTPDDFGLVAMVVAFTAVFSLFQDVGLTDATIQASEIDHKQISTLFWINVAICFSITLLLVILSPLIARFYKIPNLSKIMKVLSISYVFWGLTFQHMALLKRNMLFFRVGSIGVLSQIASTGTAIIFALAGFKYWAIVFGNLMLSLSTCILTWLLCRWRPGLPRKRTGAAPLVRFGMNSAGYYIVNYLARNLDKIVLGKKFGSIQLGYYSRAYYLATTPAGQLSDSLFHVSVSTLSKIRDYPNQYQRYYLNTLSAISFVGMPLSVFMVVMNKELVLVLLGPQWNNAAEIFSILGLAAGMYTLYFTNNWLHVSLGRSDRLLKWGMMSSTILALAFALGSIFGPKGIAWGYSITIILITFPAILYAGKPIGLRLDKVLSKIWRNLSASVMAGLLVSYLKNRAVIEVPLFFTLFIWLFIYCAAFITGILFLSGGISPLKEMYSIMMSIFSKKIGPKEIDKTKDIS